MPKKSADTNFAYMWDNSYPNGAMPKSKKKSAPKMQSYTYKAKDGSLQGYTNSAGYQKKVGNSAAGKQAAKEKQLKQKPEPVKPAVKKVTSVGPTGSRGGRSAVVKSMPKPAAKKPSRSMMGK